MPEELSSQDLTRLVFVSDPRIAPGGRRAAAVVTRIESPEEGPPRYRSRVHLYDPEGGRGRPFTRGENETSPRFSPAGDRMAFLAPPERDAPAQAWLIALDGGEATRLTDLPAGVGELAWRPDGRALAFVSRGDWKDEVGERGAGRRIERLHYKQDGVGFRPDAPAQAYLLELEGDGSPAGPPERLTDGPADVSGLAFSPDGAELYFVAAASVDEADEWRARLWALRLEDRERREVVGPRIGLRAPAPSPDGERIAFLAPSATDDFASPAGLWVVPAAGGEPSLLTGDRDAAPSVGGDSRYGAYPNDPAWDGAGALVVNLNREGASHLARIGLDGAVAPLQDGGRVTTAFAWADGRGVAVVETPERPGELHALEGGGEERRLSGENDDFVARFAPVAAHGPVRVQREDGAEVPYWTIAPRTPRDDGALVLQVHGGPHTNNGFGFQFEFQLLAARGYTVVYGNPRGGSSYGARFAAAMLGRYGSVDADDVLAIARHARDAHARADAPMHLTGGSYGGFMTNWLVGCTDEFASAVTQRSICNWLSFYGASDIGYRFAEREVGGRPWEDAELLWEQSPLRRAAAVTTPTLVLHADADHRCPVEQAEQWYVALKRLGRVDTALLRFPDEGHELSRSGRPDRRIERLDAIVDWFERHP